MLHQKTTASTSRSRWIDRKKIHRDGDREKERKRVIEREVDNSYNVIDS